LLNSFPFYGFLLFKDTPENDIYPPQSLELMQCTSARHGNMHNGHTS